MARFAGDDTPGPVRRLLLVVLEAARRPASTTVAAVRYQHVAADRDAAIARELNRLIEGG